MTGTQLHTMLLEHGASLHLDANGQLTVKPAQVAQQYKTAIQQHLCYLLAAAALGEVKQLVQGQDAVLPTMVSANMLSAAARGGDVETTRQAAVAYVHGWREALKGVQHAARL